MKNKFGIEKREDEYAQYVGKEVRIISREGVQLGVLNKIDPSSNNYDLMPSLVPINLPEAKKVWDWGQYLNTKSPTKIKKNLVEVVQEVPEGYLEEVAGRIHLFNNFEEPSKLEKIKNYFKSLKK